jgi:hypothetical protein
MAGGGILIWRFALHEYLLTRNNFLFFAGFRLPPSSPL